MTDIDFATLYDKQYFDDMDGGRGYHDSLMWVDISHAIFEVLVADKVDHVDRAAENVLVDVGCAFGYLIRHMRKRGVEAFGLDISEYAIEHAKDDIRPYLHAFDLTLPNDSFFGVGFATIVTTFETLEHIPVDSTQRALWHLRRMMRRGGFGVFNICTAENPGHDSDSTHQNIQSAQWWEIELVRAGFIIRYDLIREFQQFWLFHEYRGTFIVQRNENKVSPIDIDDERIARDNARRDLIAQSRGADRKDDDSKES